MRALFLFCIVSIVSFGAVRGYTPDGHVSSSNKGTHACNAQSTSATYVDCAPDVPVIIPDNAVFSVEVNCTGARTDNAEFAVIEKRAVVKKVGAAAAVLEGSVQSMFNQGGSTGWDVTIAINGGDSIVGQVKSPSETVDWSCDMLLVKKK